MYPLHSPLPRFGLAREMVARHQAAPECNTADVECVLRTVKILLRVLPPATPPIV